MAGAVTFAGGETVTGGLSADTLTVDGVTLAATIAAALAAAGAPTALSGAAALSAINLATVSGGAYVIFTFGTVSGTRARIALGSGNGATIAVPSGFSTSNMQATAALSTVSVSSGDQLDNIDVSVSSGGVITATASDSSGHSFSPTANWFAVCWQTGY